MNLKGKVALVTAATKGIGLASAQKLAENGAVVYIGARNEELANEVINDIESNGGIAKFVYFNAREAETYVSMIENIVENEGRIDILVNNAAVQYEDKDFKDITDEQFDKTMKTNIYGTFYMTREALKHMTSGACIINTASVVAFKGNEKLVDYSMTKGAITALTRSLSTELAKAKKNIRVNEVAPGPIWTPLIPASFTKTEVASFGQNVAMGRAGQPVECAGAYVFLASDNASYITGQTIHVNGGEIVNS